MVNAVARPISSLMLQLLSRSHIPPTGARPGNGNVGGVRGLRVVLARFYPPSTVPATDGLHTQSAAGFVLVDADVIAVETDGREVW